jgi:hypothetical protein
MNKIIIALAIATLGTTAFAQEGGRGRGNVAGQQQQQAAQLQAGSTSVSYIDNSQHVPETQTIFTNSNNNQHQSGTATLKTVPQVYAPALTSSNDTCMGSSSFGAAGVGFGITVGSSWTDANCVMLKNAREMFNMGMPDVAFARLCMDSLNREAIELTGKVCPQTAKEEKAKQTAVAAQ